MVGSAHVVAEYNARGFADEDCPCVPQARKSRRSPRLVNGEKEVFRGVIIRECDSIIHRVGDEERSPRGERRPNHVPARLGVDAGFERLEDRLRQSRREAHQRDRGDRIVFRLDAAGTITKIDCG